MPLKHSPCYLVLVVSFLACGDLSKVPAYVGDMRYQSNGQLVVFTTGGIKIYENDLDNEVKSIPLPEVEDFVNLSFDMSQEGQVAAIHYNRFLSSFEPISETRLYRLPDGKSLGTLTLQDYERSVTLSPSGDAAFALSGVSKTERKNMPDSLYRISDGAKLWSQNYEDLTTAYTYCYMNYNEYRARPVFSSDGKTLFVVRGEFVQAIDVATGTARTFANARACIVGLHLLPDGTLLVLRGLSPSLDEVPGIPKPTDQAQPLSLALYAADGNLVREIPAFSAFSSVSGAWSRAQQVTCAPAGDRCAMVGIKEAMNRLERYLLVWEIDGTLLQAIPILHETGRMSFSPDGTKIAISVGVTEESDMTLARIYRISDGAVVAERSYSSSVF